MGFGICCIDNSMDEGSFWCGWLIFGIVLYLIYCLKFEFVFVWNKDVNIYIFLVFYVFKIVWILIEFIFN